MIVPMTNSPKQPVTFPQNHSTRFHLWCFLFPFSEGKPYCFEEYGQDIPSCENIPSCEHSDSGERNKDINRSFNGNEIPDTHRCENICPMTRNQKFQNEEIRPPLHLHHRKLSKARLWAPLFLIPEERSDRAELSLAGEGWAEKGERGGPSQVLGTLKAVTESHGTSAGSIWIQYQAA